ncbi:MAG: transglutaminase-like domain-containing protein [Pirellulales bacterium]
MHSKLLERLSKRTGFRRSRFARLIHTFLGLALMAMVCTSGTAWGQFKLDDDQGDLRLGKEDISRYRIGVEVTAESGACRGLYATLPVPQDWPEQTVRVVEEDITPQVRRVQYRVLDGAVKQMIVEIPLLRSGQEARAAITLEITRREVLPPAETSQLRIPESLDREMNIYLGPSPYIESRDSRIRRLAREVAATKDDAWGQVEAIYDYVRENVKYTNGPLKGARRALRDGEGDCEELSSLFIAMCRANGIPARTVWVPGHCYPEFYLVNEQGQGTWFPCQAAGDRAFGAMPETRPILQKGDNFEVPEKPNERLRYVSEFLRGTPVPGGGKPSVKWIRELL